MKSQENQNTRAKNNISVADNMSENINPQETTESEPVTQVQKDNVITNRDLPNPLVRYAFTGIILASLLIVIAIYYGIINP
ncbi:MAG: hypothetical protein RMX96_21315 [Nostoc sp. ChiSLP02]|nr:hypothetical protein [Nostoc sp. DedSLP05]MDZ8100395.1 hypothetical protein [Nostoc sp. DedSLP01]MDZ8187374.1 hypothetical protein [Nostoc sp. ChiSLP02]